MQMRARNYSVLNRAVARAISHSVNDYYKQKNKQKKYNNVVKNYNNTAQMPQVNNMSNADSAIWGIFILFAIVGLAVAFPWMWFLYFVIFAFGFVAIGR